MITRKVIASKETEAYEKALDMFGINIYIQMIQEGKDTALITYGSEKIYEVEDEIMPEVIFTKKGEIKLTKRDVEPVVVNTLLNVRSILNTIKNIKV